MTKPVDLNALHELLNAIIDQRITAEQFADFQETLKSSSEARQVYLDFIDLHIGLRKLERMEVAVDPIADIIRRVGDVPKDNGTGNNRIEFVSSLLNTKAPRNRWALPAIALFAVAASLMIALSMIAWQTGTAGTSTKSIAKSDKESPAIMADNQVVLAQSVRASFFGELTPSLNSSMQSNHEYALTTGIIELYFPAGATAIIEAPAVFSIANATRLVLQTGQCSVHAPDGAEGFQIETPLTSIVDLGTRFSVVVDETGETDVQVVEGIAEISASNGTSTPQEKPIRLTDRQGRVFSENDGVVSKSTIYNDSQYRRGLPDRVVAYQATDPNGLGSVELVDVTVQRGGQMYTYPTESLTGIQLIHYKSASGKNASPIAYQLGNDRPQLESIIADRSLNTGVINPGGAREPLQTDPVMALLESAENPNTPGMAIRFLQPVINDVGPDIVFFDLQTFNNPPTGDAFHVGPVSFESGLRTHTVKTFDITMSAKEAKVLETFGLLRYPRGIDSIQELKESIGLSSRVHTSFRALAVGIDLSDLGYELGTAVESLFIQDALDDDDSFVDPVLIGGLPSRKEASNAKVPVALNGRL